MTDKLEKTETRHYDAKGRLNCAIGEHRRHRDTDTRRELCNARRAYKTAEAALHMARRHANANG